MIHDMVNKLCKDIVWWIHLPEYWTICLNHKEIWLFDRIKTEEYYGHGHNPTSMIVNFRILDRNCDKLTHLNNFRDQLLRQKYQRTHIISLYLFPPTNFGKWDDVLAECSYMALNDTAYKWWCGHSGFDKLLWKWCW